MKKLIKYAKPYLWHIVITTLASIGCSVANVWIIDLLKQVIDESLQGDLVSVLPMLVLKALCVVIAGMLSCYPRTKMH